MTIALNSFVWSYVGGIGYVVSQLDADSDPRWQVMNGSIAGGSFSAKTSELAPFELTPAAVPSGAPALGSLVRWQRTGELFEVTGYLYSAAYDVTLVLLQSSDRQATAYLADVSPVP